jgi:hypothetical protein
MTPTKVGTRLRCQRCSTEIIVVTSSDTELYCCNEPMSLREG